MLTCTWAPTTFQGTQVVDRGTAPGAIPGSDALPDITVNYVQRIENLGITHLLIAQRWWGSGAEIEGSSLDCLAMTSLFAAHTRRINLVTAIHPGFFLPAAIAKWGATLDRLSNGRWAINITSGWNLAEFDMYGVDALDHDTRYQRSAEFIEVLRGAWGQPEFSFEGDYYRVAGLRLEPRPEHPLAVFQGGQSPAAMALAARHSDWMFLNGGSPEKIARLVQQARAAFQAVGREPRFALYAAPVCRSTDDDAWAVIDDMLAHVNPGLLRKRRQRVSGAEGMWADDHDPLSHLDTNEGYASRLIGSPDTVLDRIRRFRDLGIEMLHLDLRDKLFVAEVLPRIHEL